MPENEDLVTVREAARLAGVHVTTVYSWIRRDKVSAQSDRHGFLVSASAVRAVAEAVTQLDPSGEYVPRTVAARLAGVHVTTIARWGTTGRVASSPGPYGQLVRLTDVLACAAQRGHTGKSVANAGMAASYCYRCNAPLATGARYCEQCGAPATLPDPAPLVGDRRTRKAYTLPTPRLPRAENRVYFSSREEAEETGYTFIRERRR